MTRKILSVLAVSFIAMTSCYQQDDIYKEWVKVGGYNYPATSQNLISESGYGWVRLTWDMPIDPMVKTCKVFWDNYTQSLDIDYADHKGEDKIVVMMRDLEGRSYTFDVINYDNSGNQSLAAEVTVSPDGENWLISHSERTVVTALMEGDDAVVTLSKGSDEMVATKFRYIKKTGESVELDYVLGHDDNTVTFPDAAPDKRFEYMSAYCRANGVDTVWCSNWTKSVSGISYQIPTDKWTVVATEGQVRSGYEPSFIFDGVYNVAKNSWYSSISSSTRKIFPKILSIDTHSEDGEEYSYTSFRFYENPTNATNRFIKSHCIYIGSTPYNPDEENYSKVYGPVAEKSAFTQNQAVNTATISPSKSGRYIAIVFTDTFSGNGYVDLWELEAFGFMESKSN